MNTESPNIVSRFQELNLVKSMGDSLIRIVVPITAYDIDNVSEHIRTLFACIDDEVDRKRCN